MSCAFPLIIIGALVIVVTMILAFPSLYKKLKQSRDATLLFYEMEDIYQDVQNSSIDASELKRFSELADKCLSIINSREDREWGNGFSKMFRMRNKIHQMSAVVSAHYARLAVPVSQEIQKLAELRRQGMISDHEFQSFSENFKVSTGEKARGIIRAISDLNVQYQKGAMSEGNYHSALWSLLDRLDRKT